MPKPKSDTPRTDAMEKACRAYDGYHNLYDFAAFTREQERELAGKDADLLTRIQNYDRVIQAVATALGGVCCGGVDVEGPGSTKDVLIGGVERLVVERDSYKAEYLELNKRFDAGVDKALEESRATVARLLLATALLRQYWQLSKKSHIEQPQTDEWEKAFKTLDDALFTLPDQSKRDAAVLRAADDHYQLRIERTNKGHEQCDCNICQAVREGK